LEVRRLQTIFQSLGHKHVDVLKMDIEGSEYEVIDDLCDLHLRIDQVLVEFHHRFERDGAKITGQVQFNILA
jgi:FkbM family methyltransferase